MTATANETTLHIPVDVRFSPTGQPLAVRTRKAQALLAYLALTPGQAHPRDKLAALLWPDTASGPARQGLRQSLFLLRQVLDSGELTRIVMTGDAVTLPAEAVQTDVAAFERAIAEGSPAALEHAVGLYRGDLLAGLGVTAPPFEDWLMGERERLRELAPGNDQVTVICAHDKAQYDELSAT